MNPCRWAGRIVLGIALVAVVVGSLSLVGETKAAGPCICPNVYAPVVCDKGKKYPNRCVADCHHAKNCVPTGNAGENAGMRPTSGPSRRSTAGASSSPGRARPTTSCADVKTKHGLKPDKVKSTGRIDEIVALIMALHVGS